MIHRPAFSEGVKEERAAYLNGKFPSAALSEKVLRAIWYDGRFEHRGLKLSDGRTVSVLAPGNWNTAAGPDFQNARLRIGKDLVEGDVEIHLRSSDWVRHAHHENLKYNRVILHAVLFHNMESDAVLNQKGDSIPHLELKKAIFSFSGTEPRAFDVEGYPYKSNALLGECGKKLGLPFRFNPGQNEFIPLLFRFAGDGRILLKGEAAAEPMSQGAPALDQLVYTKILEGLGYSKNKSAMSELSRKAPYFKLREAVRGLSGPDMILRLQTILFNAAGLLPDLLSETDEETKRLTVFFKSEWKKLGGTIGAPMDQSQWNFTGTRPHNFPARRLAGLSYFLAQNMEKGLFPAALEMAENWKKDNGPVSDKKTFSKRQSQICNFIFQPPQGYFANRSGFGSRKFSRAVSLIGEERALAIWVNGLLPFLVRWCRDRGDEKLESELHRTWCSIPSPGKNQLSQMMLHRFLGAEGSCFSVRDERTQQGLLQLFQDFCDTKPGACIGCPFPRLVSLAPSEFLNFA